MHKYLNVSLPGSPREKKLPGLACHIPACEREKKADSLLHFDRFSFPRMSRKKRSFSHRSKLFSGSFRSTPCGTLAHIQAQQNNNGNFDSLTAEKRWLSRELLLTQCDTASTSFLGNTATVTSNNCPLHHHPHHHPHPSRANLGNEAIYIACLPFNASDDKQLSLAVGEHLTIVNYHDSSHDWVEVRNNQGQVGWVPQVFIKPLSSLDRHSWFHGKVSRCEAEYLLTQGINGSEYSISKWTKSLLDR